MFDVSGGCGPPRTRVRLTFLAGGGKDVKYFSMNYNYEKERQRRF
jgi:hypothetical protein